MSIQAKCLVEGAFVANVDTTIYTAVSAQSMRTIIDKFTAFNSDSTARTLTVNLVPNGGAAGDSNAVVKAKSIAAGDMYDFSELKNHILNPGDFISVKASVTTVVGVRVSGREIT